MVWPATWVGQWHHSLVIDGLSPSVSKIQCTLRGGCNKDTPCVGGEAVGCPLVHPSCGGRWGRGWMGRQGQGRLFAPGYRCCLCFSA